MPNQLRVDNFIPRGDITLGREETPEELTARLKQENRATIIRDTKDVATFVALYLFLIVIAGFCLYLNIFSAGTSAETLRWSQSLLAAVLSGAFSYVAGHKIGSAGK